MEYKLLTQIANKGEIIQELEFVSSARNRCVDKITRWVMDTREQAIREALIKLGWTPPEE